MTFAKFVKDLLRKLDNWVLASMGYDEINEDDCDEYHDHQA